MRGISRIDQPHKHNHGFFVRVQRAGKTHSAFFSDKMHGGKRKALIAAQACHRRMERKLGAPKRMARQEWARIERRPGRSGIVGVQRLINHRVRPARKYWMATWSPEVGKVARKQFSIRKYGERLAKQLAIRARNDGLRSMK